MPSFIQVPIEKDAEVLIQNWLEELQTYWPNFDPSENTLAYRHAVRLLQEIAELRTVASYVPLEVFTYLGELAGLPPQRAAAATVFSTWFAVDSSGWQTVPAGTVVSISSVLFETVADVEFPSGTDEVTGVELVAVEEGSSGNGLGGVAFVAQLEEAYEYVTGVLLESQTGGGQDAQAVEDYLNELRELLVLLSPKAVRYTDLPALVRRVPGVARCAVLNNYNGDTDTSDSPGDVTVCPITAEGTAVSTETKAIVEALVTSDNQRIINVQPYVVDPVVTTVDVNFEFTVFPGIGTNAEIVAQAEETVRAALLGGAWGTTQVEENVWVLKKKVTLYDLAAAIDVVAGVNEVTLIEIEGAEADFTLPGTFPLPSPGTITGAVSA